MFEQGLIVSINCILYPMDSYFLVFKEWSIWLSSSRLKGLLLSLASFVIVVAIRVLCLSKVNALLISSDTLLKKVGLGLSASILSFVFYPDLVVA